MFAKKLLSTISKPIGYFLIILPLSIFITPISTYAQNNKDAPSGFYCDIGYDYGITNDFMGANDSTYSATPGSGYSLSGGWQWQLFLLPWNNTSLLGLRIPLNIEQSFGQNISNFDISASLKMNFLWVLEWGFGLGYCAQSLHNTPLYSDGLFRVDGGIVIPFSKLIQVGTFYCMHSGISTDHWQRGSVIAFIRVIPNLHTFARERKVSE